MGNSSQRVNRLQKLLKKRGPMTLEQISDETGMRYNRCRRILKQNFFQVEIGSNKKWAVSQLDK